MDDQNTPKQPETNDPIPPQTEENADIAKEVNSEVTPETASPQNEDTISPTNEPVPAPPTNDADAATDNLTPETQLTTAQADTTVTPSPAPAKEPKKRRFLWVWIIIILIIIIGGGYYGWQQTHKSKPHTVTSIKSVPLLRYGSLNGPIGPEHLFPNPYALSLSQSVDLQVFEGLTGYSGKKIVPLLSTSWTNPNKTTWVFQIAQNIKFQNGDIMTPEDVANSINSEIKNKAWGTFSATIKKAAVTGPHQVTITTNQPNALLLDQLVYCFVYKKDTSGKYYGTGPYTINDSKPFDANNVTLAAFEGYHGGSPKAKAVNIKVYKSLDDIEKAYEANKIDAYEVVNYASLPKGAVTASFQSPGSYQLYMNIEKSKGVMSNKLIREATAYAINRKALNQARGGNYTMTRSIVPKTVVGYDKAATFPQYNPSKAKQLIKQAGYANTPISFLYFKGAQKDAPILIKQLRAVGLNVKPEVATSPPEFLKNAKSGNFDILTASNFSNFNDATDVFASALDPEFALFPAYDNSTYNNLIEEAQQAFKPKVHIQKLQTINRFIANNFLMIPIRNNLNSVISSPKFDLVSNRNSATATTFFWRVGKIVKTTQD